ncbi:MAG: hypothetical protein L0215_25755 [Gemmataceae bacterium]|nr:hypothetical protein [Gemmataceae bacterium]
MGTHFRVDRLALRNAGGGVEQEKDKWRFEVILWDVKSGEMKQTLAANLTLPVSLAFSPDGKSLATAGARLGDVKDGAKTTTGEIRLIPLK